MTVYALPAFFALIAKAGIYFYSRYSRVHNPQTRVYLLFLFSLSVQNLAEIMSFDSRAKGLPEPATGVLYFSASVFAIAFLLHLALTLGLNWREREDRKLPGWLLLLIYAPVAVLQGLLLTTPLLISGFQPISYTYTKISGPLYFLFELYAFGYLSAAIALFVYGARTQTSMFRRLQNRLLLVGLLPIVMLVIAVLVLQHLGFTWFNTTVTLPLAITFFLAVSAYATHQYRLFDIEFFLPWSKVRERKTAFYRRIRETIAALAELRSVQETLQLIAQTLRCQVALIGGPKAVAVDVDNHEDGKSAVAERFPVAELRKIEQIVVAREIEDSDPAFYRLMTQHRVGAIVPFTSFRAARTHWLLLGDHFSSEIYTPLDFKAVEELFSAIAERFLDDFLRVRDGFHQSQAELRRTRQRLGLAWHREHELQQELNALCEENQTLRAEASNLQAGRREEVTPYYEANRTVSGNLSLDKYLIQCEQQAIVDALAHCEGNKSGAARLLGISTETLEALLERHGMQTRNWTAE